MMKYIEVLKLHPKMDPDYVGPYFIDGITRKHNYWLRDKDGERLQGALPLSRLKLVNKLIHKDKDSPNNVESDSQFYDIETILMDRQRNKKKEFFVKWLNLDDSNNSWVPEENFQSPEIIKQYFKNKRKLKTNKASNMVQLNYVKLDSESTMKPKIFINQQQN